MSQILLLAGGSPHAHDFSATGEALTKLITDRGHEVTLSNHPEAAAACLEDGADALVVDGLWWRMLGDAYDQWRNELGYSPSEHVRASLSEFVRSGGGLLAVHTAVICFDDWPEWGEMLGGAWRWGHSSHPPPGPVTAHLTSEHPVVAGSPSTIELHDEVYGDLAMNHTGEVLAVARRHPDDADQPVLWTNVFGAGRVVVNSFGHDADSIRHRDNARILQQGLDWVLETN